MSNDIHNDGLVKTSEEIGEHLRTRRLSYLRNQFELHKLHALRHHGLSQMQTSPDLTYQAGYSKQRLDTMKRHIEIMAEINDEIDKLLA